MTAVFQSWVQTRRLVSDYRRYKLKTLMSLLLEARLPLSTSEQTVMKFERKRPDFEQKYLKNINKYTKTMKTMKAGAHT